MASVIGQRWDVQNYSAVTGVIPRAGELVCVNNTPDFQAEVIALVGDGSTNIEVLYSKWKVKFGSKLPPANGEGEVLRANVQNEPVFSKIGMQKSINVDNEYSGNNSVVPMYNRYNPQRWSYSEVNTPYGIPTLNENGYIKSEQLGGGVNPEITNPIDPPVGSVVFAVKGGGGLGNSGGFGNATSGGGTFPSFNITNYVALYFSGHYPAANGHYRLSPLSYSFDYPVGGVWQEISPELIQIAGSLNSNGGFGCADYYYGHMYRRVA